MQRGDGSYRKTENCETAVNKDHHNVGSYPLRYCGFFWNAFSPFIWVFLKLYSSKLWLFLECDCLKYYNGNGKVREVFYEKISDTTVLTLQLCWQYHNVD